MIDLEKIPHIDEISHHGTTPWDQLTGAQLVEAMELQACLTQAGFGGIEVFGDRRTAPPGPGEQRVYFMAVREETTHG